MSKTDLDTTDYPMKLLKAGMDVSGATTTTSIRVWLTNVNVSAIPSVPAFYACMIWASEHTSLVFKSEVISTLIGSECRYIVTGGLECEQWHDLSDEIYLATDPDFAPPKETMVMTSWHEDEPMEDVIEFLLHSTDFHDHGFTDYLILHVGQNSQIEENLASQLRCSLDCGELSNEAV